LLDAGVSDGEWVKRLTFDLITPLETKKTP
jgi:hypothetical protein